MDTGTPDLSSGSRSIRFVRAQSPDPDQSTLIASLAIDLVSENEESNGNEPSLGVQELEHSPAFQNYALLEASESEQDPFGHVGSTLD